MIQMIQTSHLILKDKHRLERLKKILKFGEMETSQKQLPLAKIEEEWCSFHMLVQSSLNHISEICMMIQCQSYLPPAVFKFFFKFTIFFNFYSWFSHNSMILSFCLFKLEHLFFFFCR